MPISINEVAARAGVSKSTVSKVLNNTAGFSLSSDKRLKIQSVADELGYKPNQLARSLGRGRTDAIGVMVSGLANPFFANLLEKMESTAVQSGYHAFVELAPKSPGDTTMYGNLSGWPVDGILLWAHPWQVLSERMTSSGNQMPVVYLGYPRQDETDWVAFDLYSGGRAIAEHLLDRGYKKTWYLTPFPENVPVAREARIVAYLDVCRERGQEGKVVLLSRVEETRQIGIETGMHIASLPKSERPDAVICHNDVVAVGVYHACVRAGLRVPEDIAVTGFDGLEEGQCLVKPLTTVMTSCDEMSRSAIETLLLRIDGKDLEPRQVILPCSLIKGETS